MLIEKHLVCSVAEVHRFKGQVGYRIPVVNHPVHYVYFLMGVGCQSLIADTRLTEAMHLHFLPRKLLLKPQSPYQRQSSPPTVTS